MFKCIDIHLFLVDCCWSRAMWHFFAGDPSSEYPQRKMQSWNWTHNIHGVTWKGKKKGFSSFLTWKSTISTVKNTVYNYSSVWHHQPKGSCWLSGIVCKWHGRLHPCSWILFAGSFLGCQQRFILGSLIMLRDGSRGRRDRSFALSPYFYAAYSLFTTSLCRTAACHQSSVFS